MRLALASLALSSMLLIAGCAAASDGDDLGSSEDELSAALTNVTVVDGALAEGDTLTVPYHPAYDPNPNAPKGVVPYLAIALDVPNGSRLLSQTAGNKLLPASLAVSVEGDFPSSPEVLVTDAKFRVLARAKATDANGIDTASIKVPTMRLGNKFVLVRDPQWDKPMTFNLALGR